MHTCALCTIKFVKSDILIDKLVVIVSYLYLTSPAAVAVVMDFDLHHLTALCPSRRRLPHWMPG